MKYASKTAEKPFFWLGTALVIAAGLKAWLVLGGWMPFNSDEAVVALMARHILRGDRPAFFYGQAYMGSLDAFFVAGAFAIFGEYVWAIRLVQSLLFLAFLVTTAFLGRTIFGSWALGALAALLLAVPPVNLALYTDGLARRVWGSDVDRQPDPAGRVEPLSKLDEERFSRRLVELGIAWILLRFGILVFRVYPGLRRPCLDILGMECSPFQTI